ncbi:MAG TPA: CD1871A family CXXC motif-containing protein [Pseudobacteroides sp.]
MKNRIRISLLIISTAFIAYAVLRGEVKQVFRKAVLICLECIGIG